MNFNAIIRDHVKLLAALGTGILIGSGACIMYQRLFRNFNTDLANLAVTLETLKRDVDLLRQSLEEKVEEHDWPRRRKSGISLSAASSEDEDDFHEAIGGSGYESARDTITSSDDLVSVRSSASLASDTNSLFETVDALFEGTDQDREEAYHLLNHKKEQYQKDSDFLWRLSKAMYMVSQIAGGKGYDEEKKTLVYQASECAKQALQLNPHSSNVHKWCAITLGSVGDYESTQVRIQNGWKFKEHIQRAIKLSPRDPSSHYLLGRWCFGVYMLTWMERQVAATFFATPPSATIDEALGHFLQADRLDSGQWKENMLFIAKITDAGSHSRSLKVSYARVSDLLQSLGEISCWDSVILRRESTTQLKSG